MCGNVAVQVSSVAHGVGFGVTHFSTFVRLIVHALLQFLGGGCIVASAFWYIANTYMRVHSPHRFER